MVNGKPVSVRARRLLLVGGTRAHKTRDFRRPGRSFHPRKDQKPWRRPFVVAYRHELHQLMAQLVKSREWDGVILPLPPHTEGREQW